VKDAPADTHDQGTVPPDERSESQLVALAGEAIQQLAVTPFRGRRRGKDPSEVSQNLGQSLTGHGLSFPLSILYPI
jgi:hypothetical protein